MRIDRRQALGLGAASLATALLPGCHSLEQQLTRVPLPSDALPPAGPPAPAFRLLNRVAYGPRPGDVSRVEAMGIPAYVDEQLHPEAIEESAAAVWRVRSLNDSLDADTGLLFDQDDHRLVSSLRQAAILRAVYSSRQLYERMVEFWSDHFNVYAFKGQGPQLIMIDDRETVRKHALGRFRDLLGASARSAAMLGYLDNGVNRKGIPNENYARELMELHTLGVDGGYTQRDVREVARCFTGWTSETHWHRGRFVFRPDLHDDGAKRVLQVSIPPGGGASDGERVLDILAAHPSTARHLARKLCVHFLGDASSEWADRLAGGFRTAHGDIRAVLRPLLTSPDLLSAAAILKRPFDYVVSALRAFNVDTDGGLPVQQHLERMGQPLFAWPMPDGFPDRASAWTGALVPRWNFALALVGRQLADTTLDAPSLVEAGRKAGRSPHDTLIAMALGADSHDPAATRLRAALLAHSDPGEAAAVVLMSPDFQWR